MKPDASKWHTLADKACWEAALEYCDLFPNLCSTSDGTITMHHAIHRWPNDIVEHGSLGLLNAQGLEARNQASKNDDKTHCNRHNMRTFMHGGQIRGRMAQILAKSIIRQYNFINHHNDNRLSRHVKTADLKVIRKGHKIIGV